MGYWEGEFEFWQRFDFDEPVEIPEKALGMVVYCALTDFFEDHPTLGFDDLPTEEAVDRMVSDWMRGKEEADAKP